MTEAEPRGIRNDNPGNVRYDGTAWDGLADPPSDGAFCRFVDPQHGIRVICKLMLAYQAYHGLHTVRAMIDRWAPPSENDTDAYAQFVAGQMGIGIDEPFAAADPALMTGLVKAIITQENGQQPYDDATIALGLQLAGITTATGA